MWTQLWKRAATYDADVRHRAGAPPTARRGAAARGRGPGRADGRSRRHPQGAPAARWRARDRDRAHGLPRPRHGVRVVAVRVCDGLHVLCDRPDGPEEQPDGGRDRGAGRSGRAAKRRACHATTPQRLGNVVFMGMGEPLANERHVFGAIARLTDAAAFGLGARHITMSTVGLVPGIRHLTTAHPQVGLAVRFHAASDELRSQLVPPNDLYPLADLEAAMAAWRAATHRRPSIEWAMIDRVNDTDEQAVAARADRAAPRRAREPDPAQPDPGLSGRRFVDGQDPSVRRRARARAGQRDGARHPRPDDRRRVRPARAQRELTGRLRPDLGEPGLHDLLHQRDGQPLVVGEPDRPLPVTRAPSSSAWSATTFPLIGNRL